MVLRSSKEGISPGFGPDVPEIFSSLEEARNSHDYQWNLCQQKAVDFKHRGLIMQGIEQHMHRDEWDALRNYSKISFCYRSKAFRAFLEKKKKKKNKNAIMDSKALQAARVLQISSRVVGMRLDITTHVLLHDQTCWDELMPTYKDMLDLAAPVVAAHRAADRGPGQKPIFQVDQGIIAPLFSAAHKCRDPSLRRRAIALLYSAPIQEGV